MNNRERLTGSEPPRQPARLRSLNVDTESSPLSKRGIDGAVYKPNEGHPWRNMGKTNFSPAGLPGSQEPSPKSALWFA